MAPPARHTKSAEWALITRAVFAAVIGQPSFQASRSDGNRQIGILYFQQTIMKVNHARLESCTQQRGQGTLPRCWDFTWIQNLSKQVRRTRPRRSRRTQRAIRT